MSGDKLAIGAVALLAAAGIVRRGSTNTNAPDTANFRRWFKSSAVVRNGKPLVVYHGTPDMRKIWSIGFKESSSRGKVFFATDRFDMANSYADPKRAWDYQNAEEGVLPLYLSIQNPMIVDWGGEHWRGTEKIIRQAKSRGHDGVIVHNVVDWYHAPPNRPEKGTQYPWAGTLYAWFEPNQAKSAATGPLFSRYDRKPIPLTGPNSGDFNPDDPRISFNRSPYPYMSLGETLAAEPAARTENVSKVARSKRGFMRAYEAANGDPARMGQESTTGQAWTQRRDNFVKRHMAQLDKAWDNGQPTRRHLALMMWAYTPTPGKTRQWLQRKGSRAAAPGYRSFAWRSQDWRAVKVTKGKLDWSKKCGAEGTRYPDSTPALCLPFQVIQRLNRSTKGRKVLRDQAVAKMKAKKGERVPWDPMIKKFHAELEAKTEPDKAR